VYEEALRSGNAEAIPQIVIPNPVLSPSASLRINSGEGAVRNLIRLLRRLVYTESFTPFRINSAEGLLAMTVGIIVRPYPADCGLLLSILIVNPFP
jgi:hypothetical protein